jgi:hypothetical protein
VSVKEVNWKLPNKYELYQNYPNPFNPTTTIEYYLPEQSFLTLKVFDALGREVKTLVNEEQKSGSHKVTFDVSSSSSNDGRRMASGIYIYQLKAGDYIETKKMLLLR